MRARLEVSRWDAVLVMGSEVVKKCVTLGWTWPNVSFSVCGATALVSSFPFVACVLLIALAVRLIRMPEGEMKRAFVPEGTTIVKLPTCDTRYELYRAAENREEKGKKKTVVIAHGFSGDVSHVRPLALEIRRRAGCDVLIYDLVGRGHSSCRGSPHTAELFVSQLAELLFALNVNAKIHFVGVSLGGGVVLEFAKHFPQRVASLAFIASVGLPLSTSAHVFTKIPLVPDFLFRYALWSTVVAGLELEWSDPSNPKLQLMEESYRRRVVEEPALGRSLLSTARHFPLEALQSSFRALTAPVLLVWGDDDRTCPVANAYHLKQRLCQHADLVVVENARHCVYTEFVAEVAHALTLFLQKREAPHLLSEDDGWSPTSYSSSSSSFAPSSDTAAAEKVVL
mmetsp:Transcript_11216/g.33637  ORF Transcript_11216/g.33637 Transcript_11216/m.33637 type:complete len:397 (+) Transcript_11216:73-1263(+)